MSVLDEIREAEAKAQDLKESVKAKAKEDAEKIEKAAHEKADEMKEAAKAQGADTVEKSLKEADCITLEIKKESDMKAAALTEKGSANIEKAADIIFERVMTV